MFEKFNHSLRSGTPAERRLARYYLEHPGDISYETAATVADRLDLSPMTVGRFLRSMNIDSLRQRLGAAPLGDAQPAEKPPHSPGLSEPVSEFSHISNHIDALRVVQALALQPLWRQLVDALSRSAEIYLSAMPAALPMSHVFASRLAETRDNVRILSGQDGTYLDLLGSRREDCMLVAIDDPVGSQRLQRLCRAARDGGHRVAVFTATPNAEMEQSCDLLVRGPARSERGGLCPVGLTAMIELAVSAVAASKGPFAIERAGKVAELQRYFTEPA